MEYINCMLCNANNTRLLVKKNAFNVVQCKDCDLVYLNPRMNGAGLAELYNLTQDSTVERIAVRQREDDHDAHKIRKFKIAINLLKRHKRDIQNVFDLGCSTGIFLGMVAKEGWTPYGNDVNRSLVEKNQMSYGDQVKLQAGNGIDFPDQSFDAVTLFDSIEHIPEPIVTLKEVGRVMRDDGFVIITTPDVGGLFPGVTYTLLGRTIGAWEHPTPPGHMFQFSMKTLDNILEKAGLEIVDSRNFEIYMPYTVGELENSIINALRKNNHNRKILRQKTWSKETIKYNENHIPSSPFHLLKRLPRFLIRGFCWGLVTTIYPIARILGKGDAMIVIAKKRTSRESRNM